MFELLFICILFTPCSGHPCCLSCSFSLIPFSRFSFFILVFFPFGLLSVLIDLLSVCLSSSFSFRSVGFLLLCLSLSLCLSVSSLSYFSLSVPVCLFASPLLLYPSLSDCLCLLSSSLRLQLEAFSEVLMGVKIMTRTGAAVQGRQLRKAQVMNRCKTTSFCVVWSGPFPQRHTTTGRKRTRWIRLTKGQRPTLTADGHAGF